MFIPRLWVTCMATPQQKQPSVMADDGKAIGESPCSKKSTSCPQADAITKKHNAEDLDDSNLTVFWDDTSPQKDYSPDPVLGQDDTGKLQFQSPSTLEAKIDKMLALYVSLDGKIQSSNQLSNERLTELRDAHNRLVNRFVHHKTDIVERDIRISNLESDLMDTKQDLGFVKQDLELVMQELARTKLAVGDLIHTTGMVNTRIDYVEKSNLDQWAEIKKKKLILSGIPEAKGENVKTTVTDKLKAVLKKSAENQQTPDYKGAKFATNADSFRSSTMDCAYRLGKFKKRIPPKKYLRQFCEGRGQKTDSTGKEHC